MNKQFTNVVKIAWVLILLVMEFVQKGPIIAMDFVKMLKILVVLIALIITT